jgi:ABC-type methionine transport system ATPase subunit
MVTKRVKLIFPPERIKEPVIYNLGKQFRLKTNILEADLHGDTGWLLIEVEGPLRQVERGLAWAKELGIGVEEVEECSSQE